MERRNSSPSFLDRILAASSYLTLGMTGFVWYLVSILILKNSPNEFLMYNFIQSFILSVLFAIFYSARDVILGIFNVIPFIGKLFLKLYIFLFETPLYFTLDLFSFIALIFLTYLALFAMIGKLPFIPFITDMLRKR